jgi:hypothetical protein
MGTATGRSHARHRLRFITTVLAVAGLATGCVGREGAFGGRTALLPLAGDLVGAGQSVQVTQFVDGDVMLVGGTVQFSGVTNGTYLGSGGDQDVGGRIGGNIRAAGGTVRLRSNVGGNATIAGGQLHVEEAAVVGRNAYLAGGQIDVSGTIEGALRAAGGDVTLNGPVGGDVTVEAGQLHVGPDARIDGNLRYRVREGPATIDPGAVIGGEITSIPPEPEGGRAAGAFFLVARILAFLLAGGVVVAVFSRAASAVSQVARTRTLASLGLGVLWVVGIPLAVGVAAITLIGIPLAVIIALLYCVSLYLAPIPAAIWLGDLLLARSPERRRLARVTEFLAGGLVIATLSFLPFLGLFIRIAAGLVGLGAAALAVRRAAPRPVEA